MVSTEKIETGIAEDSTRKMGNLSARFNRTVRRAQAAIFIERLWPRTVPPLCVSGMFLTASWVGLWHALPAQGRMAGVIAFAAATAISPFLTKAKSLRVTKKDALDRIDDALGEPSRPAHMINDHIHESTDLQKKEVFAAHRLRLLETWVDKLETGKPRSDVPRRDPYHTRYLIAASVALAAVFAGDQHLPRLTHAFNWQAPIIPVKAKAWVNPPENFQNEALVLSQDTVTNTPPSVHKNSMMTILVYERNVPVSLNGVPVPLLKENLPKGGSQEKPTYQYEFKLNPGEAIIAVGDTLRWKIDVRPDEAPTVTIESIGISKKEPTTIELQYREKDDYGVQERSLKIIPPAGDPAATPLPSISFPTIDLN